jgi:hypothetical protein
MIDTSTQEPDRIYKPLHVNEHIMRQIRTTTLVQLPTCEQVAAGRYQSNTPQLIQVSRNNCFQNIRH